MLACDYVSTRETIRCYNGPMTNPIQQGPLSDEEFDRLDDILSLNEETGLTVEGVDGFFAALACSPVLAKPSEWIPIVWGGEPPEWETPEEALEATGLLMRLWNQVAESINDGSFAPLMSTGTDEDGNEVTLPHPWCMGFVEGMRVHEQHWFDESKEELQELMRPIGIIAWDAAALLGEAPENQEQLSEEQLNAVADMLPETVLALRGYWMAHPASASSDPVTPQVPGDDPCPCGSGKKFKHCHGASFH